MTPDEVARVFRAERAAVRWDIARELVQREDLNRVLASVGRLELSDRIAYNALMERWDAVR